jgi:hypothetical protein
MTVAAAGDDPDEPYLCWSAPPPFMDEQEMKAIFNANRRSYPPEQLTLTEN